MKGPNDIEVSRHVAALDERNTTPPPQDVL